VPLVRLDADPGQPGWYRAEYTNGFIESGQYQIIFYARDQADDYALPVMVTRGEPQEKIYLPMVRR